MKFETIDDFEDRHKNALITFLTPDERFAFGIEVYHGPLFLKRRAFLVLTDRRVILLRRRLVETQFDDIDLEQIEEISYHKGLFLRRVVIKGSGFNKRFRTLLGLGEQFAAKTKASIDDEPDSVAEID